MNRWINIFTIYYHESEIKTAQKIVNTLINENIIPLKFVR